MDFDLQALLAAHRNDGYELYGRYLNPQHPKVLHAIGFNKVYERAEGAYLYDTDGNQYADFLSGFGVFAAGRNHPVIRQALHDALDAQLADWTQFDCGPLPGLLAERLLAKAPGLDRVFFCNSGTEAVESALKFARYATGRRRVVYCDHAFHGLTTGSLSINGSAEFRRGFDPLLPDTSIPLGDLDALQAELRKGDVAALIIEPIQGKGVHMPPDGFLAAAAKLLHSNGALLICDEVQSGFGRTGKFFAYQHEEVTPEHRHRGQGALRRVRAGRRDAGHRAGVREGLLLDGPGHGAQRHVQGRRAGHDGRAGRAASPGRREPGRRTPHGPVPRCGRR